MFIDSDILITWGAIAKKYHKGEFIFHEDETPRFYYQIIKGKVRLFNTNDEGKEFTQSEFNDGESFGEPPLFIDECYPSASVALEDSVILKTTKEKFLELLDEYPPLQKKVITLLARRIYSKTITAREIVNNPPETRILAFLHSFKKKNNCEDQETEIPYTRQEIADYTGLRVETIIRTLSKMQDRKQVKIINRKLIF